MTVSRSLVGQLRAVFRRALRMTTRDTGPNLLLAAGPDGLRIQARTSRARVPCRGFVESGIDGADCSPLAAAAGGVLLGSEGWVAQWRQRLAEQPDSPAIPGPRQLAWRPTVEDVVQAVCNEFDVLRTE